MDRISALLVDKMLQRNIINDEKKEIYHTGIKLILADMINFFLILMIGLFTKSLLDSVLYIIILWTVRCFSEAVMYGCIM